MSNTAPSRADPVVVFPLGRGVEDELLQDGKSDDKDHDDNSDDNDVGDRWWWS